MSDQMNLPGMTNAISSPGSASGRSPFDARDGWIQDGFGPEAAHASLSARQAKEAGLVTSGTCGLRGSGSSSSAALQRSLESRLMQRLKMDGGI